MKQTFILLLFTIIMLQANSQDEFSKGRTSFMLKPMLNLGASSFRENTASDFTSSNMRVGYGIGLDFLHCLSNKIFVTAGAELNSRGYKSGGKVRALYFDIPATINYITKPMSLLFSDDQLIFGAGAFAGIGLTGKYGGSGNWTNIKFGEKTTDNRSRTDYGYIVNLGYKTEDAPAIMFSFSGGLKNVIPGDRQTTAGEAMRLSTTKVYLYFSLGDLLGK